MNVAEVRLTHQVEFCAAHHLVAPGLSASDNQALYGPCARPHGHNYRLEVTVAGPVQAATGMVMDLNRLRALVAERLVQRVDHLDLNRDVEFLLGAITTGENLLVRFWDQLAPALPEGVRLVELRLGETRDNGIVYHGPAAARA
ncbi:MAG: 6-carboxytetrahydropterin synthase [Planctomycetota bacterium]|nr:MAG: 6-carboxytetrahydropterin synthase [Planctomycetota bacterium]